MFVIPSQKKHLKFNDRAFSSQKGEIAALMTIVTMGIMLVGVIVGVQLGSQPTNLGSRAQVPATPTSAPTTNPTPTGKVPGSSCFRVDPGTCSAKFTYVCDPILINSWLENPSNVNDKMYLDQGLPAALDIKGEFISVFINPSGTYPAPNQSLNGKIVTSLRSGGGITKYFGYANRPSWVSGASPVNFYIQYQTRADRNANNGISYIEKATISGGCATTTSPTPTTTVTPPTVTPGPSRITPPPPIKSKTPSPSPTKTPTPTVTPGGGFCGKTCKSDADCGGTGSKYICFKGDRPVEQEIGVCRLAACSLETDCSCELTPRQEACTIKSVAYVNECGDTNCSIEKRKPIEKADKDVAPPGIWGVLNDNQYSNSPRPQPAGFDVTNDRKSVLAETVLPILAHIYTEDNLSFLPDRVKDVLARSAGAIASRIPYREGDTVKARLYFDKTAYQLFQKRLDVCRWNGKGKSEDSGFKCIGEGSQFINRSESDINNEQTTIDGIKLACNREYQFGWTLQKCDPLDIFFVVDASNSMSEPDQNGVAKIQLAKDSLKAYLNSTNLDLHRAAIIQFNRDARLLSPLSYNRSTLFSAVDQISQQQYTRIDLGLKEAFNQMIQGSQQGHQRVVILISDGLPDPSPEARSPECQGNNPPQSCFDSWISQVTAEANNLKAANGANSLLVTVGLGDPNAANLPGTRLDQHLAQWASDNPDRPGNKLTYNTSTNSDLGRIIGGVVALVDQCAATAEDFSANATKSDINGDGIVNSIDYFLILDSYLARGTNLAEDINGDGVVNSLDLSLVIEFIGVTVN